MLKTSLLRRWRRKNDQADQPADESGRGQQHRRKQEEPDDQRDLG